MWRMVQSKATMVRGCVSIGGLGAQRLLPAHVHKSARHLTMRLAGASLGGDCNWQRGTTATGGLRNLERRGFANGGGKATQAPSGRKADAQNPEWLFRHVKNAIRSSEEHALVDGQALRNAVFLNVHRHWDRERGLVNAIELAKCSRERVEEAFVLPQKAWTSILLRMIEVQFPVNEMTDWMDSQPVEDLTKAMIYVVSSALQYHQEVDIALLLLDHLFTMQSVKKSAKGREALMNYLVNQLLRARPSVAQVEQYVKLMKSSRCRADDLQSPKLVWFLLNPLHHEQGRSLKEIAANVLAFYQEHCFVLKWQSSLRLSKPVSSSDVNEMMEKNCELLEQQLENFIKLDPKEREEYSLIVEDRLRSPERLYGFLQDRKDSGATPMDYDLYSRGIYANVHHHQRPLQGLSNGMEIARWMRDRGFQLPRKSWHSILLKMIEMEQPVEQMTQWMDSQPVHNMTSAMVYVLSNTLVHLRTVDVVLDLLQYYLETKNNKVKPAQQRSTLRYLLDPFLDAQPSIEQLERFVSFMTSHGTSENESKIEKIVRYYVNPSRHRSGGSGREIAVPLLNFWRENERVLTGPTASDSCKQMGRMLGKCGSDGVRVAKEILEVGFGDDGAEFRNEFAEAVESKLETGSEEHTEFLEARKVLVSSSMNQKPQDDEITPEVLFGRLKKTLTTTSDGSVDYRMCNRVVYANASRADDPYRGLRNAVEIAELAAARGKGYILPRKTWDIVLLQMIKMNVPIEEMTQWMDSQSVKNLSKEMICVLSKALDDSVELQNNNERWTRVDVVLQVLKHGLRKLSGEARLEDRQDTLRRLLQCFLKANPSRPQFEEYCDLMKSHRVRLHSIVLPKEMVSFQVNPQHHEAGCSSRELAARFFDFWRKHEWILSGDGNSTAARTMGTLLGNCGSDGVRVAKELLNVAFADDNAAAERVALMEALRAQLDNSDRV